MMTPRSSPIGSAVTSGSANSRRQFNVRIRLTLMMRANFASGYTPSLPTMRCEPPMPAQFIKTRAIPWALSALARPALTCSSSATSAWGASPFSSAATFSAFSLLWSSTAIFAPLAAMARAVAAPKPEPPPVMRTATSFNCMIEPFLGRFFQGCMSCNLSVRRQHASANQRFHMLDVLAADLVGDRPDAGRARHRVPPEEQMIAGADQAGVEQHRIDGAELAGFDTFGEQAAMKTKQRRDEEFGNLVGGLGAALVQEIMNQPVHIGELVIGADNAGDMQLEFRGRRDRLRQQIFEIGDLSRGIPRQQRQQQSVLVAEMILYQRSVDPGLLSDVAERYLDRGALDHQLARRDEAFFRGGVPPARKPCRYAGSQLRCHHRSAGKIVGKFRGQISRCQRRTQELID